MAIDTFFRSRLISPSNHLNDFASWSLTPVQYFWGQRDLQIIDDVVYEIKPLHYRYQEESMLQTALMVALFIPSLIVGTLARDVSFFASSEVRASFVPPLKGRVDSTDDPDDSVNTEGDVDPQKSEVDDEHSTTSSRHSNRSEDEENGKLIMRELPQPIKLPVPLLQKAVIYNTLNSPVSTTSTPSSTSLSARPRVSLSPGPKKTLQDVFVTSPINKCLYRVSLKAKEKQVVKLRAELEMLRAGDEGAASGLVKWLDMQAYYTKLQQMVDDPRYIQSLEKAESEELGLELKKTYAKASLFFLELNELPNDAAAVESWLDEKMSEEDYDNYFLESFMLFHPYNIKYRPQQMDNFYDLWRDLYTQTCEKLTKLNLIHYLYEGLDEFIKVNHQSSPTSTS